MKPFSAQGSPVMDDIYCSWHPVSNFCLLPACKCPSEGVQKEFVLLLVTEISSLLLVPQKLNKNLSKSLHPPEL